jgi:hypothetical protein
MNPTWCRALAPAAILLATLVPLRAQQQQPPPPASPQAPPSPYCGRLEAQLAAFDRSNPDAARADQLRRLEESADAQQNEIARQEAAARHMGCEQNSFFVLFSRQPAQCGPLNNRIQQLQARLEQTRSDFERLHGAPPPERDGERRALLGALAHNNCGAQYQAALTASQPRAGGGGGGLFESLFGPKPPFTPAPVAGFSPGGSYRTICVRSCDGFYYPISYATTPSRFGEDEQKCRQSCPAAEATLFAYPNPGGDVTQAMSVSGQAYTSLPNAFRYRQMLDPNCSCRHPGESWSQALKNVDDPTVEQGDIVVNEQRAKQMSQPRVNLRGKSAATPQPTAAPSPTAAPQPTAAASAEPQKPDPNRKVREVGPVFIPAR